MGCTGVTSTQEAMWLAQELAPDTPNNVVSLWDIDGDLDSALLDRAMRAAVAEAASLTVNFRWTGDGLGMASRAAGTWRPFHRDFSRAKDPAEAARALVTNLVRRPFDLAEDALLRIGTIRLGPGHHLFVLVLHHILTDAFGVLSLLSGRVAEIYRALRAGTSVPHGALTPPGETAASDDFYRASSRFTDAERFWRDYLAGDPTPARLPRGVHPPAGAPAATPGYWDGLTAGQGMVTTTASVPAAELAVWKDLSDAAGTTLSDLLTAAASAFLRHMCGLSEPLLTITVNHRVGALRRSLGLLSNRVPMRSPVDPDASLVDLAQRLREERRRVLRHARYDVSLIKRGTGHAGDARSPFGTVVNVLLGVEALDLAGTTARFAGGTFGVIDEVMVCVYTDGTPGSDLYVRLDAPRDHYDLHDVTGFTDRFVRYLRAAMAAPFTAVGNISALDSAERRALLTDCAGPTVTELPETLADLLDRQARATPDAVAVIFEDSLLTFRELARRAGSLASCLARLGAGPERFVAVAIPRSPELVVALVAVLMAGAAYVPVDPDYPAARVEFMLADAEPVLLLTVKKTSAQLPPTDVPVIEMDDVSFTEGPALLARFDTRHPAYMIYTSGSTGRPKGTVVTHSAIVNRLRWMQDRFRLDASDRVLQKTSASFDVSVWEFFWPLITGATLVVASPDGHRDPGYLADLIHRTRVTTVHFVPSMLAEFVADERTSGTTGLRRVVCSGETLTPELAARFHRAVAVPLHNLYGPTETAVDVTAWRYREGARTIPIGNPIWNTSLYVLDARLEPLPPGVFGELYIAGAGLARGYHGRLALTAERFVACPFGSPGRRMYRTGDLARWNTDGELEYAGRVDQQVKIRGHRVELREIEAVVDAHPGVRRSAVVARPGRGADKAAQLVAYVVPVTSPGDGTGTNWDLRAGLDMAELRGFVADRLPAPMLPAAFVPLHRLPLTANGKLDRAALPEPEFTGVVHKAPRDHRENVLAAAFAEVLGLSEIGTDDDFFVLGGDSIRAIQVVARARANGVHLRPRDVFDQRTVAALARGATCDVASEALAELEGGAVGLLPLPPMARLYAERGAGLDRLAQWLVVETPAGTDLPALRLALRAVLDRHDVLRSRLTEAGLLVPPRGTPDADGLLARVDCDGDWGGAAWQRLLHAEATEAVRRVDAGTGRMLRLVWFEPAHGGPGRLLIAAHHLIVDGVSWRILLPDLATAWRQARDGQVPVLPAPGTSLRRWLSALAEEATRPERVSEVPLWRDLLTTPGTPVGSRPLDPRRDLTSTTDTVRIELSAELTAAALTVLPSVFGCGADDVLLTALLLALAREHRGLTDGAAVVRLEGHGRHDELVPGADLAGTIGWFTDVTPVRFDISGIDVDAAFAGGTAAGDALKRVKEQRRSLPDRGIGYTLLRYVNGDTAQELRSLSADEIGFNFLGHFSFERRGPAEGGEPAAGVGWAPAPEQAEPVSVPAPDMPAPSALELNSLVTGTGGDARLTALFTFASGVLTEDEVRALADAWRVALCGLALARGGALTPSDVPLARVRQSELDDWGRRFGHISDVWPLTPLQGGLIFHTMLAHTASEAYQTQFVFRLEGRVDGTRLRAAGQTLLDRHPNLRVAILPTATGEPVQVVVDDLLLPWRHEDLTGATAPELRLEEILSEERDTRFRPEAPPLLRFTHVTLAPGHSALALTAHHVLLDGWSVPLIERELMDLYAGPGGEGEPKAPRQYRDFLHWLSRQDTARAGEAWAEELAGVAAPTLLAPSGGVASHDVEGSGRIDAALTGDDATRLAALGLKWGVTPNTLVQGAWGLVLAELTGREDVLFGATVAGRPEGLPGADTMIGLFINTVPVRLRCAPGERVVDVLSRLQAAQAGLLDHHHLGLADIQRTTGLSTLFDTLVVFESFPVDRSADPTTDPRVTGILPYAPPHYPLTVIATADPLLRVSLQYRPAAFARNAVESIADRLVRVLEQLASNPDITVGALDLLSDVERDRVLHKWNGTEAPPPDRTVPDMIAEKAAATPDAVCVVFGGHELTYRDLERRAAMVARRLMVAGVGPESRVVVLLPRSADLVVALLAVWKAGGTYVPVDPEYPAARVRAVIEDCSPVLVLDEEWLAGVDPAAQASAVHVPCRPPSADHAAYIIYTSGSTGKPKGVVVRHGSLTTLLTGLGERFALTPEDRLLACATVAFDIAVLELFLPLLAGARVVLADRYDVTQPTALLDLIERARVTVMQATPALWQSVVTHMPRSLTGLRVISTGEALPLALARTLCESAAEVTNLYGPTETTVYASAARLAPGQSGMPPSIGEPVAGTRLFVLNRALRPVPPGATGDLWIAGEGLARGYHGRPGLTAERFVACPYGPPGARMYRSGDLARWTTWGEVEYLGRSDHQIKLRGFRIEPAEIEHALTSHPAVRRAVVVAREDRPGDRALVAYVVPEEGNLRPAADQLRQAVGERLPSYMIPAAFVTLPELPVTPNGKVDRSVLPQPEFERSEYQAPRSPAEAALCDLFAEVLDLERVGRDDDFFLLGGHSLLATRLVSRVRAELGVDIPMRVLFAAPTAAQLTARWDEMSSTSRKPLRRMTER